MTEIHKSETNLEVDVLFADGLREANPWPDASVDLDWDEREEVDWERNDLDLQTLREIIYWPRPTMTSDISSTSERVAAKSWTAPNNENNIASAEAVCI